MKSAEIRDAFLSYFESQGHTVVPSSSLVPGNDPTLLFTNAGMVQFKDVFLGADRRHYNRATSSQRCVRAGGKHNDLENVGYTARHHTFFEMLGNFSFGDYFKREAIQYAWQFLTEVLKLPAERLWITVHVSDDEAASIWLNEVGVSAERFSRLDEDNFWQMGDTGPCGPCSEIFYDHGADVPGGPPGSPDDGLDRYIEIWNLVFMQYERQANGDLIPLPKPSVDTGMGLERIAAVMQSVHSNYEIDLFQALLKAVATLTGAPNPQDKSLRVIADHIRSSAFLIADGVLPSNEGRGYVLRRIIRRAVRHGHKLGQEKPFFHQLVAALVDQMGDAYPELVSEQRQIEQVLLVEEEQFAKTLDNGMGVLEARLAALHDGQIPGEVIFQLYDTYGFPVDLTNDIARERGLSMDLVGYQAMMDQQRERARASGTFKSGFSGTVAIDGETRFEGYDQYSSESSIAAILKDGVSVRSLDEGDEGILVLKNTPFYAESGGQIGDSGYIEHDGARFEVTDCQKSGGVHLHVGKVLHGHFQLDESVRVQVDNSLRNAIALNHSATHLLHASLRSVLGAHVAQKGSLVDSERLRFDFAHFEALKPEELDAIEEMVNAEIRRNTPVEIELLDIETARKKGAVALFGEKYGDTVRVLTMGNGFSMELCGGTHVSRTGDIGLFKIVSEAGIASGIRRIEAVTGGNAFRYLDSARVVLQKVAHLVKASPDGVLEKVGALANSQKQLEREVAALKARLAATSIDDWIADAVQVDGINLIARAMDTGDVKILRDMVDRLKNRLGNAVILLAGRENGTVKLVAGVSQEATGRVKAGDLVRHVADQLGGKGGGRPDMAQGGGNDSDQLEEILKNVVVWISAGRV